MLIRDRLTSRLSPNVRGAATIISGSAVGQLIALFSAPLLARLYGPADFGVFAVLTALIVTIGTIGSLRFDLAIPLPSDDRDAHSLVAAGLLSAIFIAAGGTVLVAVAGTSLSESFNQPGLMPWLWLVPILGAVMSSYLLFNQLAIRDRRFGAVARRNVFQSVGMVIVQLIGGLAGIKSGGLTLGFGCGQLFGALSLTRGAGLMSRAARSGRSRERILAVAFRYRRFPLILTPSGLLNVLGLQLPIILIAFWYGGEVAGWLGLTQRVLALPVTLVGTAVAQVYLAELARAARGDLARARQLFKSGTRTLLPIAGVLLVALVAFGPSAFSFVFGAQWYESGEYARALAVGLAAQMIGSPLSQTLIVMERQGLQFAWDACRVAAAGVGVALAFWLGASALTAVWVVGLTSATLYGVSWCLSYWCLRRTLLNSDASTER